MAQNDIFSMLAGAMNVDPEELRKAHAATPRLRRLEGAELDKVIKDLDDAGGISLDGGKTWLNSKTAAEPEPEAEFDPSVVHLVRLAEGDGDTTFTLVNSKTYNWIINGGKIPACNIQAQIHQMKEMNYSEDQINDGLVELNDLMDGKESDNDRAINAAADIFNGETFDGYRSVSEVMKFVQKHGLTLSDDEYEGLFY